MDEKIKKLLYNVYDRPKNDEQFLEILRDYDVLYKERISEHRWWDEYRYVIKVENIYIGYIYAETTGDMSASEAGYDFDPDSICEMKQIQKTITTYIKKGGQIN